MKKNLISVYYFKDKLEEHNKIKNILINKINSSKKEEIKIKNKYITDSISELDWSNSKDFNREWVKFIFPYLQNKFDKFAKEAGYQKSTIINVWFQKYHKNDTHGWHVHGENYTGVYYVSHKDKKNNTEYFDFKDKKIKSFNVEEGDIIVFPSFLIHRSPKNNNLEDKLIISFNIEFNNVDIWSLNI